MTGPVAASAVSASTYFEYNYVAAATSARRHLSEYRECTLLRRYLVAALGSLGKRKEADAALQKLLLVAPRILEAMARQRPLYVRPDDQALLLDGFRKAGWQL